MPPEKQPEFMQKSKYFQKAGDFAKPIESLIPQETLDMIKQKTDAYIAEKEKTSDKEKSKQEKKKQEAEELFNRLAKPEIEKKTDKEKSETEEKIKENFTGYNNNERENMERLIETVE